MSGCRTIADLRLQLEAQRTANTREQADLRNKLFNSRYPHHKTEEGQKMILDLLASSERVGLQIKAELDTLNKSMSIKTGDTVTSGGRSACVTRLYTGTDGDPWVEIHWQGIDAWDTYPARYFTNAS